MHIPVLLDEVLETLAPKSYGLYLDGTEGFGGHSRAILQANATCEVCGLDRDLIALNFAHKNLEEFGDRVNLFNLRFSQYEQPLNMLGWKLIDGALLDLGVSSYQLETAERGFSFKNDGPLDMCMGTDCINSACEIVNSATFNELKYYLSVYGEEPLASRIANTIIKKRNNSPILTTLQLANIVMESYPASWRKNSRKHPATKTFQALRIVVNNEIQELEKFLETILDRLKIGGRLVIISFHSIEDRLVKKTMRKWADACRNNLFNNYAYKCKTGVRILFKKPIEASKSEIMNNPRSRSAKLRAIEKINIL